MKENLLLEILLEEEGYLFNDFKLNDKVIDHILINNTGIFVIASRTYKKCLVGNAEDDYFEEIRYRKSKVQQIPNPVKENDANCYNLASLLDGVSSYMVNLVVFMNNNCDFVDSDNCINLEDVDDLINSFDEVYSDEEVYKIVEILQEHLEKE